MLRTRAVVLLSPLIGAVLAIAVYRGAYVAEAGSRAGAEPGLAGAFVAAPFVVLMFAQVGCAVGTYATDTDRARVMWAAGALVLLLVGLVAAFWLS